MITQPLEERYKNPGYWTGKLQLELFRLIKQHLTETGLSQNQFAAQIGVSKSYMSQVLNGNFDHKLSKLVGLALAIGKVPRIEYENVDTVIKKAKGQYEPLRPVFVSKPQKINVSLDELSTDNIQPNSGGTSVIFNQVA